jgi:hypothetical protein
MVIEYGGIPYIVDGEDVGEDMLTRRGGCTRYTRLLEAF